MSALYRRDFLTGAGASALLASAGLRPGQAWADGKSRVVVVRGKDPEKMLRAAMRVFKELQGEIKGKKVVLKPNMSFNNPDKWGNNTSPGVARAVARLCQELGAGSITAVDHTMGAKGKSIQASGVGPALQEVKGVQVISADDKEGYVKKRIPGGKQLKTALVPRALAEAQLLINVPVAKQHTATKVSLGLKNLMGLVWDRAHFHEMINLHQGIADLALLLRPRLTVIDATRVMVSNGPQGPGKVEVLDTLLVSTDPVAADAVALGLTQWGARALSPGDVAHIQAAALLGLGNADLGKIKVVSKRV